MEWDGGAEEGEMLALAGSFLPHISVSLSHYKSTYQDSPKPTSFLDANNIPACSCMVPTMKHVCEELREALGLIVFLHGAGSSGPRPKELCCVCHQRVYTQGCFD